MNKPAMLATILSAILAASGILAPPSAVYAATAASPEPDGAGPAAFPGKNESGHDLGARLPEEGGGVDTVVFQPKIVGPGNFGQVAGVGSYACPDGTVWDRASIIFRFSANKTAAAPAQGSWAFSAYPVPANDVGSISGLEIITNGSRFELEGSWDGGFFGSSQTPANRTAIVCSGTPLDEGVGVTIGGSCGTDVMVNFAADNQITGDFLGNVTCTTGGPEPPQPSASLTVHAQDLAGNPLEGMWVTVSSADGSLSRSGFTPFNFTGNAGGKYIVTPADYAGITFARWQESAGASTGSNNIATAAAIAAAGSLEILLPSDQDAASVTAYYDLGGTLPGLTPLSFKDGPLPDLAVKAVSTDSGEALQMWVVVDPQQPANATDAATAAYKVHAHNYKDITFDRWDDGSKDPTRAVATGRDTTVTAYYKSGP